MPAPERYARIDWTPPDGVRAALRRGLELHDQGHSGDGLQPDTVAWARRLADGEPVSFEKARKMAAWFARHDNDVERRARERDKTSPAYVAWLLWGGDAGLSWATKLERQMDAADNEEMTASTRRGAARSMPSRTERP
jgi:hypothetical protein